jgi:dynein light intermediate chain 1
MVPSGWDTWGKINVLRDGYDPASILSVVEKQLREGGGNESLEGIWERMIPDTSRSKVSLLHHSLDQSSHA